MRSKGIKESYVLIAIALSFLLLLTMSQHNNPILRVSAAGNPDEYGNRIVRLDVWQWNVTSESWADKYTIHWSQYYPGVGLNLAADSALPIKFRVWVYLNDTFASNVEEAADNTRVKLTIEDVCSENLMTYFSCEASAPYYLVKYDYTWNVTGQPVEGIVYDLLFDYEARY